MYLLKKKKQQQQQVTQLFRRSPIILKNMIMFTVAGLILGALYTDTLSNWPDGGDGYCGNGFYDDGSCGRNGDDDPEDQPHLSYGDCESRIWPGVQTDMDLTYRQVFESFLIIIMKRYSLFYFIFVVYTYIRLFILHLRISVMCFVFSIKLFSI
jgi:hypothetical protein